MRDALGPGTILGYCTNVHAGTTLAEVRANLERHACAVKAIVAPREDLGVGLWLPAAASAPLARDAGAIASLRDWLRARGLLVFTINGFPSGDFHGAVVKHAVYEPDWSRPERLAYTRDLITIARGLAEAGSEMSISTLPVGWPRRGAAGETARLEAAAASLRAAAASAAAAEAEAGVLVHVDLEPEPGCLLERSADVAGFFARHLLGGADEAIVRRHVRVCHDACHAAVMFEEQAACATAYARAGALVGKVQLSSAACARFDGRSEAERRALRAELGAFVEERYLHQTVVRGAGGGCTFFDDLPAALAAGGAAPSGEWRVHFHVPVFAETAGALATTRDELVRAIDAFGPWTGVRHFEVETYAWGVLPAPLRDADLAAGIARELNWVRTLAGTERAA
jgi:sugar phosphate isomerase/epimerase